MRSTADRFGSARDTAVRLLAASLLLVAQILGATLAGASLALPRSVELCVGAGGPLAVTLPADETPDGHRHEPCPGCLACPVKSPAPSPPALPEPGPAVAVEPHRPAAVAALPAPERTLRPPGRAPPVPS